MKHVQVVAQGRLQDEIMASNEESCDPAVEKDPEQRWDI